MNHGSLIALKIPRKPVVSEVDRSPVPKASDAGEGGIVGLAGKYAKISTKLSTDKPA